MGLLVVSIEREREREQMISFKNSPMFLFSLKLFNQLPITRINEFKWKSLYMNEIIL
ncbi:MAG: hypothetical protein LBT10_09150 [Methanobrevibacter sp.]|jgi:hypothetical protein|nr:hypothetical protein [Methanobrevibacter sp.]